MQDGAASSSAQGNYDKITVNEMDATPKGAINNFEVKSNILNHSEKDAQMQNMTPIKSSDQ